MWKAPTPDERLMLLGEHRHRFPLPCRIPVSGDRGARIDLPFLLGNPTGSLRPISASASPAFSRLIGAVTLGNGEGDDEELVRDCVLWPDPGQITAVRNRWPKMVTVLGREIARKIGLSESAAEVRTTPAAMAPILDANPSAILRRFTPPGEGGKPLPVVLAIGCPERTVYDAFTEALASGDAAREKLVREFADAVILGSDALAVGEVCDRWPGLMLLAIGEAIRLASAAGAVRLGEW